MPKSVFEELTTEADRTYPFETGGVLAGYLAVNGDVVVQAAIGPGPKALHKRWSFLPDHDWQCKQLDDLFSVSHGRNRYLGDWHTHPDASPRMSWLDRRTLAAIAKHPQTQLDQPLMLIGGGKIGGRSWIAHRFVGKTVLGLAEADQLTLSLYAAQC
jgi:integrative and conjugative element protein (TIGR02256 family)